MIKGLFTLLIIAALIVWGVVQFGGVKSDATERGRAAKDAIKVGMAWTKVIDDSVAGKPSKYQLMRRDGYLEPNGAEGYHVVEGYEQDFRFEDVDDAIKNNQVPDGFYLKYFFSHQVAFQVFFDSSGKVEYGPEDMATMADLLQTRE